MSRPICYDLIDTIFAEVGLIKEKQKNKENMNNVLSVIKNNSDNTVVYFYKDGEGNDCPYYLYEYGCSFNEDEDEDDY